MIVYMAVAINVIKRIRMANPVFVFEDLVDLVRVVFFVFFTRKILLKSSKIKANLNYLQMVQSTAELKKIKTPS